MNRISISFTLLLVFGVLLFQLISYSWLQNSRQREAAAQMEYVVELAIRRFESEVRAATDIGAMIEAGLFTLSNDCDRFVDRARRLGDRYNVIAAGTREGAIICSSPKLEPAPSVADREWFIRLFERNSLTVSSIQESRTTGDYNMIVASPVNLSGDGAIEAIGVGLKMTWLSEVLREIAAPREAVVGILDEAGRIVARSSDPSRWIGQVITSVPVNELIASDETSLMKLSAIDSVERLYAARSISVGGQHFLVYAGIPVSRIAAQANTLVLSGTGVALIGGIAIILLFVSFGRRMLVQPLKAAEGAARSIAAGDLSKRLSSVSGVEEVKSLAESINDMVSSLRRDVLVRQHAAHLANIGYWQIRPSDGAMIWSLETFNIFGVDKSEFSPSLEKLGELIHPEDRNAFMGYLSDACGGRHDYEFDFRLIRPDGKVRHCQAKGDAKAVENGAEWIVGIVRDITDRHELEKRYQQAQRLEAVGQLTGGVAHDFNNILTVVIGNSELLEEQLEEKPHLQRLAQNSLYAAEKAAQLTEHLLAFARRQALAPRTVDINALLLGMEGMLRRTLPESVDIEFRVSHDIEASLVDPSQLESALLNLFLNARDAMPNGGKLTIETAMADLGADYTNQHADLKPGRYVMLTVSDNGVGMTPEIQDRVFDPFFTTKGVGKGSGMGLSMVYGFAKQSNGHVKIYSEPGKGTTFHLFLPVVTGASGMRVPEIEENSLTGGTERILVVEDDIAVREYVVLQLERLGYRVVAAGDGAEALQIFDDGHDFDLILTDVILRGEMSGVEVVQAAQEKKADLKSIYMSGYTENAIVHNGRLDVGLDFLAKPFHRQELARKLREVLDRNRHHGSV